MSRSFPYTKDNRIVLRVFSWLTGAGGVVLILFGWLWSERDLPGMPFGMEALRRVFGTALVASACWAAMLSQIGDPELRRKGLRWFAAAHFVVLVILHLQSIAIWPQIITSKVEAVLPLEFFLVLFMLIHSESYFIDRETGIPTIPAPAIEPVRTMYERQIREAGAQEERNRLARDLHDSIRQQIFVIQTAAATAQTRFDIDRAGATSALEQIRNSAREAMTELEVMMDQLRSVPLENGGLVEALKKQCEALGHRTGAHVDLTLGELPPDETVAPGSHEALLRVAQEALANIGRHARPANVVVSLGSGGDQLELRIHDDGVGFDPSMSRRGMGIANMRARAEESGGQFHLTSRPGSGTTLAFCVPLSRADLPGGNQREYFQQAMLFAAMFTAVMVISPAEHRTFAIGAWGIAGAVRLYQWRKARRRLRTGNKVAA